MNKWTMEAQRIRAESVMKQEENLAEMQVINAKIQGLDTTKPGDIKIFIELNAKFNEKVREVNRLQNIVNSHDPP